ncbi:NAD-dependent epimerase/dehydratase family protein [Agromyces bauzanensis]|uniref:Dihydroflavonol-4-reductase n=1 Tax=Agromyces bauzanensis TaxID=1308924 RepID=A0A917UPD6_9MICO|nr:NAD-dependent epimerase/dehydratase family protein [Agromyces bauzanensis]GGJ72325.1 dihydroflavonol-4-reductase [Agromyces bauzanensis]
MNDELVLVTGGTGFVGSHCIVRLLDAGYQVRTTLRSLARADDVRALVRAGGADPAGLEYAQADLLHDDGWHAAAAGAIYVLHVASPFPVRQPKDASELIAPARDGSLRVLRAARDARVRRVVLTSSFAAVGYSSRPDRPFTEEDWTDPDDPGLSPYVRSKAIAERAAWDFVDYEGGDLELSVVNPVGIFGPALGADLSSSVALLRALLTGRVPAVPHGQTSGVDVRDVADLHVRAMMHPDASGERFLAVSGEPITYPDLARLLRERLGDDARRVPRIVIPDWVVRIGANLDADLRAMLPELNRSRRASSEKAQSVLGWRPRPRDEAIIASAESLLRLGLV